MKRSTTAAHRSEQPVARTGPYWTAARALLARARSLLTGTLAAGALALGVVAVQDVGRLPMSTEPADGGLAMPPRHGEVVHRYPATYCHPRGYLSSERLALTRLVRTQSGDSEWLEADERYEDWSHEGNLYLSSRRPVFRFVHGPRPVGHYSDVLSPSQLCQYLGRRGYTSG